MNPIKENLEFMKPENDFIFKKIFGAQGNEEITKEFLRCILGQKIKVLEFKDKELLGSNVNDKRERLDIKAILDSEVQCDIEIQITNYHNDTKRILDYWAKLYRESIETGKDYNDMKKTIVIYITTYDMDELKEIEKYKTMWKILEVERKTELTDNLEIVIIELSKAKKLLKDNKIEGKKELLDWIKFLINPCELEENKMGEVSEEIKKAYEEWQKLNRNSAQRDIAERRYLDLISLEHAKKYERNLGIKLGEQRGEQRGEKRGEKKKQIEIVKKMLKKAWNIESIIEITGLTETEINEINSLIK